MDLEAAMEHDADSSEFDLQNDVSTIAEILKFAPRDKFKEIALVSKNFYEAMCSNESVPRSLNITEACMLDNENFFRSIFYTQRKFDTIRILVNLPTFKHLVQLKKILFKFGSRIRRLRWENASFCLEVYMDLLNHLPNLKELVIVKWHILHDQKTSDYDHAKQYQETSEYNHAKVNLHQLRKLCVLDCDFKIENVIAKIPSDVLDECILLENRFDDVSDFLMKQKNIKRLCTDMKKINLRNQCLTHLSFKPWAADPNDDMIQMLHSQRQLEFLEVMQTLCMHENELLMTKIFQQACGMRNLQVLKVDIENVSRRKIGNIVQLTSLKMLQLSSDRVGEFDATNVQTLLEKLKLFSSRSIQTLTQLSLNLPAVGITGEILNSIGKSFQSLKSLELNGQFYRLEEVLNNFRNLETLKVTYNGLNAVFSRAYFVRSAYSALDYQNLRHLNMSIADTLSPSFKSVNILMDLIGILPNLESLELHVAIVMTDVLFENILNLLQHLKVLRIRQQITRPETQILLNCSFCMMLCSYVNQLEELELEDVYTRIEFNREQFIDVFSSAYEAIIIDQNERSIKMRKARKDSNNNISPEPFAV